MLKFLRNFFQKLFGGGSASDRGPATGTITPPEPDVIEDQETDTNAAPATDGMLIEIERTSSGKLDTFGKLSLNGEFLCYCLENPLANGTPNESSAIPAGTYPLSLRTEGGKHATYLYRFGDQHKGILTLNDVPGFDFPHIHIGNEASYTYGSIVVGTKAEGEDQVEQARKVLYSEQAYLDLYGKVVGNLEDGMRVSLKIS